MKTRPDFTGARFFHFDDTATVAVVEPEGDQVLVGVALLSLPRYSSGNHRLHDTCLSLLEQLPSITSVTHGDSYSRSMGRLISFGRAKTQRGYSSDWSGRYEPLISRLKKFYSNRPLRPETDDAFSEAYVRWVGQRTAFQRQLVRSLTKEGW